MKLLVAIVSCHRDRELQQAQRDTWFLDLTSDHRFFLGNPKTKVQGIDEVFLDVDDSYASLPHKTQSICRWALNHGYTTMFKCDTDTLINSKKAVYNGEMYLGGENADVNVPGFAPGRIEFCSGGAGYWLSEASMTIVAQEPILEGQTAEDVFVASALLKQGIHPVFDPYYRWRPGSEIDKDIVSLHLSSALQKKYTADMMYDLYGRMKGLQ